MGKVYLKTPKVSELGYRQSLLLKREELTQFPESIWDVWASKWLSDNKDFYYGYVVRKKDGLNVGEVSYNFDSNENMPFIFVFIESIYRRNYYGQEAVQLILDRCLKKQKFEMVGVKYLKDNIVLTKFFNKLGFKLYKEDETYMYAKITKEDYQISDYIDELGRVKKMPISSKLKTRLVEYIASKFKFGQLYSDRAIQKTLSDNVPNKNVEVVKNLLLNLGYFAVSNDNTMFERIK